MEYGVQSDVRFVSGWANHVLSIAFMGWYTLNSTIIFPQGEHYVTLVDGRTVRVARLWAS